VPLNFFTLWQWHPVQQKWWFYSPILEASGGLDAVANYGYGQSYLDFECRPHAQRPDACVPKRIGVGEGFWVNKP